MAKSGDNSLKRSSHAIPSGRDWHGSEIGMDQGQDVRQQLRRVTERNMAIDVSEEIALKGQELREMTRDLDLIKVDVGIIANVIRLRGASAPSGMPAEDADENEPWREGA
jgi:hypothetical protein